MVLKKNATYPDQHGDYWAGAILELSPPEYVVLQKCLAQNEEFVLEMDQQFGICQEFDALTVNITKSEVAFVYSNQKAQWFKLYFLKDGRTIIMERSSS
ncbi:MAG: hypothetical protein ACO1OQ_01355 [Rufibacter sp.]